MKFMQAVLFVLALTIATFMAQTAFAQRFGSRSNSLVSLVATEAVQKHLGIVGDVAAKLNEINDRYRNDSQKEFTALGIDYSAISDLPAAERAVEMRKATEKSADVNRKLTTAYLPNLEQVLSPDQIQRLKQIQLQASGIDVWTEPEVAKQLEFSDEQKARLAELRTEYSRRTQQIDGDFQQRFAKIRELNTERDNKALDLLTAIQKSKLTEIQGPPFDISQLGFRRRGNN